MLELKPRAPSEREPLTSLKKGTAGLSNLEIFNLRKCAASRGEKLAAFGGLTEASRFPGRGLGAKMTAFLDAQGQDPDALGKRKARGSPSFQDRAEKVDAPEKASCAGSSQKGSLSVPAEEGLCSGPSSCKRYKNSPSDAQGTSRPTSIQRIGSSHLSSTTFPSSGSIGPSLSASASPGSSCKPSREHLGCLPEIPHGTGNSPDGQDGEAGWETGSGEFISRAEQDSCHISVPAGGSPLPSLQQSWMWEGMPRLMQQHPNYENWTSSVSSLADIQPALVQDCFAILPATVFSGSSVSKAPTGRRKSALPQCRPETPAAPGNSVRVGLALPANPGSPLPGAGTASDTPKRGGLVKQPPLPWPECGDPGVFPGVLNLAEPSPQSCYKYELPVGLLQLVTAEALIASTTPRASGCCQGSSIGGFSHSGLPLLPAGMDSMEQKRSEAMALLEFNPSSLMQWLKADSESLIGCQAKYPSCGANGLHREHELRPGSMQSCHVRDVCGKRGDWIPEQNSQLTWDNERLAVSAPLCHVSMDLASQYLASRRNQRPLSSATAPFTAEISSNWEKASSSTYP